MAGNYPEGVRDRDFDMPNRDEAEMLEVVARINRKQFARYVKASIADLMQLLEMSDALGALTDLQRGAVAVAVAALQEADRT